MKKILVAFCLSFFGFLNTAQAQNELYMYIWAEYIPDSVLADFTKETGIKVKVSTFDNLDDMYAKIKITGGQGFDIVMPSIEYAARLKNQGFLQPLDKSLLPNAKNLDPKYLNLGFDPNNEYTLPFTFGTTTFAVNKDKVDLKNFTKLEDLTRPEFKNRILLVNDVRGVIGIGLRMKGYSINDTSEEHIKEAYELLKEKVVPNVKGYDTEAATQAILNGEVDIAMTWNGLAYAAAQENPNIVEVHMDDGMNFWIDNLAVLRNSKNLVNAHKFLDYIMRPDVSAKITEAFQYSSPNMEGRKLLDVNVRTNETLYPKDADVKKGEFELDLGSALRIYEKYWTLLRSGS